MSPLDLELTSALYCKRASTTFTYPLSLASWIVVLPFLVRAFTLAPLLKSNLAISPLTFISGSLLLQNP